MIIAVLVLIGGCKKQAEKPQRDDVRYSPAGSIWWNGESLEIFSGLEYYDGETWQNLDDYIRKTVKAQTEKCAKQAACEHGWKYNNKGQYGDNEEIIYVGNPVYYTFKCKRCGLTKKVDWLGLAEEQKCGLELLGIGENQ